MKPERAQVLFDSHYRAVYGFVLRSCADPATAEDLTQDVFLRALRDGATEPPESSERPWLLRIARNLLIDRWRRHERRPPHTSELDAKSSSSASKDKSPTPELRTDLVRAIGDLPDPEREAFLLCEVAGLSYAEIGQITEATDGAVRSRIYRARIQLRKALSGGRSTAKENHDET